MNENNTAKRQSIRNALVYMEDAKRLRQLAVEAQTVEAKAELEHLAKLYERLAQSSLHYAE